MASVQIWGRLSVMAVTLDVMWMGEDCQMFRVRHGRVTSLAGALQRMILTASTAALYAPSPARRRTSPSRANEGVRAAGVEIAAHQATSSSPFRW